MDKATITVSIEAPVGFGKTLYLKQLKAILELAGWKEESFCSVFTTETITMYKKVGV